MKAPEESVDGLRVNYLIIFLSGMSLFIGAVLIFMLIIQQVFGRYDLRQILPTTSNLSLMFEDEASVAVLYSKYTEVMLPEGSTWINDNVATWERFVRQNKMVAEVIQDEDIELGNHFKYSLIALPGCLALSDKQVVQLKKFIEQGGSVFASSGTGSFSNEGKWKGWQFFTEVFGLNFSREILPEETYRRHTLRGNIPITAGIPTGFSLKIATWDRPIYAEILEPRANQVSFWYDYRREAGLVQEEIQKSAGIAHGTYGNGRWVWMGFEFNSVIGQTEDYVYFDKLFINSVNWLLNRPTVFIHDWPSPYEAAAVLIPTIDEQAGNISNLSSVLNASTISATIFMDPYDEDITSSLL
ncbi:MAG: ThuA domain-containing protein [Melioribacteraceae bacterium]|nr:ThuA domain-containing protein [Melioribacteraceae bacterium]